MSIMVYNLYTIPLCNFGIAHSHAICVIIKYFVEPLSKTILQPKSSPIFYPGENRNLKSPDKSPMVIVFIYSAEIYARYSHLTKES